MHDLVEDIRPPALLDQFVDLGSEPLVRLPVAGFGIDVAERFRMSTNMLDELGLGMDSELPEDPLEMVADSRRADRELVRDRGDAATISRGTRTTSSYV